MTIAAWVGQEARDVEGRTGESLYAALRRGGLPILSVCGGRASCGACRVEVLAEWRARLPGALETEWRLLCALPRRGEGDRLSCQILLDEALEGLAVRVRSNASKRIPSHPNVHHPEE